MLFWHYKTLIFIYIFSELVTFFLAMGQTAGAERTPEDDEEPRIRANPTERSLVCYI